MTRPSIDPFPLNWLRYLARPAGSWLLVGLTAILLAACSTSRGLVPQGTVDPDRYLIDRGLEELKAEHWLRAREYLRALVDGYPQSPHRPDGKLGIGDTYLGENTSEALVLAINEFREFLAFFPTHARADYAQAQLGYAHFKQMRGPQRDQTETKEAIKEYEFFLQRYPNSPLLAEVKSRLREARDRLGDSEYSVGFFYFRTRWYPGAIDRFKGLLKNDPEYTGRDAVYFHLAEALLRTDKKAEALPYYERVVKEFEQSEYLDRGAKAARRTPGRTAAAVRIGCSIDEERRTTMRSAVPFHAVVVSIRALAIGLLLASAHQVVMWSQPVDAQVEQQAFVPLRAEVELCAHLDLFGTREQPSRHRHHRRPDPACLRPRTDGHRRCRDRSTASKPDRRISFGACLAASVAAGRVPITPLECTRRDGFAFST